MRYLRSFVVTLSNDSARHGVINYEAVDVLKVGCPHSFWHAGFHGKFLDKCSDDLVKALEGICRCTTVLNTESLKEFHLYGRGV